ncbi:hypothetical protein [Amycolatopsis sp. NPDC051128]|uniref:hypothetical protein n=1 Tax=Amycolatopsis sp. NPDC051128 TaxID=3155412 RepID=UPI00342A9968
MIPCRTPGAVLAARTGLVVLAGPASPATVDISGIPGWVWILVAVVGVLAAGVVLLRLLKGPPKD